MALVVFLQIRCNRKTIKTAEKSTTMHKRLENAVPLSHLDKTTI